MTEDYKPSKHEFGTPESAKWAKSMTPGQEGTIGIPDGKASMKFKDVRPKKDQVKETSSGGLDFTSFRKDIIEANSHKSLHRKVKYASQPGRPGKQVSKVTKEIIRGLKSYGSRSDAQKSKAGFNKAKEVWEVTLHTMQTKIYVRELRKKGQYFYYLSFDNELPYLLSVGEKKIPQKDWKYFGDTYEYFTFREFDRNYTAEENVGMADDNFDPNYQFKGEEDEFEEKVKGYKMKGSGDEGFTLENYHKKSWIANEKYEHDDGSVVAQYLLWRWGSGSVSAPNLVELVKKLEADGGFDSRMWDDWDSEDKMDGYSPESPVVIKGPKGLRPDTPAWEEWEESLSENELYELDYEEVDDFDQCTFGPILITDEDGKKYIFSNGESVSNPGDAVIINNPQEAENLMVTQGWDEEVDKPKKRSQYEKFFKSEDFDADWETQFSLDYEEMVKTEIMKDKDPGEYWYSGVLKRTDFEDDVMKAMFKSIDPDIAEDEGWESAEDLDMFPSGLEELNNYVDWTMMHKKYKDEFESMAYQLAQGAYNTTMGRDDPQWQSDEMHFTEHEDGISFYVKTVDENSNFIYIGSDESNNQFDVGFALDTGQKVGKLDLEDFLVYLERLWYEGDERVEEGGLV